MQQREKSDEFIEDSGDFVEVSIGISEWQLPDGRHILEEDFKVKGEIWRVHKSDPDPLPSKPHAHCIDGSDRFKGCKLHLGTGHLFDAKNKPLGRKLEAKQFQRLLVLIRPKFPSTTFPL